jgi:hypothetical protein
LSGYSSATSALSGMGFVITVSLVQLRLIVLLIIKLMI